MPGTDAGRDDLLAAAPAPVRESLGRVCAASDFVTDVCTHYPDVIAELYSSGDLSPEALRSPAGYFDDRAPRWPGEPPSEPDAMSALRRWRRREMVRIAWRDLAGWTTLEETLAELSAFADAAIGAACDHAWRRLAALHGEPRSARGEVQRLIVVAMGKLGGYELNFSSDVDLIFLYPERGETSGPRAVANEEFFTRMGQALIRLLDTRTADGLVFRVDMRLRPFGGSGPLVSSFAALEDYLEQQGRDWERYAWVKARPVTQEQRYGELYAAAIRPFVYRRYLDFGVFESLREMKALIEREVVRRELQDDVKLGPGGIREVEFIVQALQLIRGGRDTRLQTSSLLTALAHLDGRKLLSRRTVAELRAAYVFLRRLENRLQMLADEQTHRWSADAGTRERLAAAMGLPDGPALARQLARHRERVSAHFHAVVLAAASNGEQALIDLESATSAGPAPAPALASSTGSGASRTAPVAAARSAGAEARAEGPLLAERLRSAGFGEDAAEAARLLEELPDSALVRKLDQQGRKRLAALLGPLAASIGASPEPLPVLRRVLRILEAIGPRSAYFALLYESAGARQRLTELAATGDFLAHQIASYPLLLDELIDERVLSHTPSRAELAEELRLALSQVPQDDPERQVEALRHFQQAAVFHVAVADLSGRLPVMRVSDRLTEIAELILERALDLAWTQMAAQFGTPRHEDGAAPDAVDLCAVGYGKLGGFELGYSSDLDLVFLHDLHGAAAETDGPRPIDNASFFIRVAQRVVHLLTLHSAAGRLYEVDVRLRPSGKGGLLVTSLAAFAAYQESEAWTWEHQALLHARPVAGAPRLRAAVERLRMEVLTHHVRHDRLREDVRTMRERMRRELSSARAGQFDIKQDAGGIADIEFLAQYWALEWARDYPAVAWFSDTIRELESVASADLVPQSTVDVLTRAYREYRGRVHHLSLDGRRPIVSAREFAAERAAVSAIWTAAIETPAGAGAA